MQLEITCRETKALIESAVPLLIDCREVAEWDLVHIEGATLLPMSQIAAQLDKLAGRQQEHLIVYCHHGMRSAQVAMWLRGQGFANTQSMAGGIDAWAAEIDPQLARY